MISAAPLAVQIQLPRLFLEMSPSAKTSKGFLFVVTRFTWSKVPFKQTASRISRRIGLFDPRHVSAAFWLHSDRANTVHISRNWNRPLMSFQ